MISALNRRQQSNGNNMRAIIFSLFVLSLIFSSCGGTDKVVKRSPKPKKDRTSKGTDVTNVKKKGKVKEVEWTEAKDDKKPPIVEPVKKTLSDIEILKEDVYDISYFVPFNARTYDPESSSDRFIQYYSGMLIATEILEKNNINININVVDEKKARFENVLSSGVNSETDVIIGPYSRKALKVASKYAYENQVPLVSPWQASSKITEDNPYYVQLRPNLDEHYYSIFEDIKANGFDLENVHIIARQTNLKDGKRLKKLHRMAKDVWGESDENHLQEFLAIQDSLDNGETAFDSIFIDKEVSVAIIPNWSFEDENFIYGALRKMSVEKGMSKLIVYGMPIMINSDRINFDYYSSLNMRVARSKFVDERDGDVQRFKRDFVDKYGALPTDDAYEGYDNLMYIGRNLSKYGKNFQYFLGKDQGYYLQAGYNVEITRKDSTDDSMKNINYFENKNVDIIEFKNNRFVRNLD